MRPMGTLTAVLVLVSVALPASAQDAASLRGAIEVHYSAIHSGDLQVASSHHLPEFSWFSSDGRPLLTTEDQEGAARMGAVLDFGEGNVYMSDFDAQIYGDVGVATFYLIGTRTWGGETKSGTWRVSAVWVHDGDTWREAHHHESPLAGEIHP